jgi:beta-glucanase (GH16 family)
MPPHQPYPQAPPAFGAPPWNSPFGPPPPEPSRRRRWVLPVTVAVVVLLLVAGGVAAWQARSGDDDAPPTATSSPTLQEPDRSPASAGAAADPSGDEFDGTTLAQPRWGVYGSTSPNGSVWSKDAVTVRDGILRITATGRNPTGGGNVAGGLCWCGPGGNRSSGVWSVRARFDAGAGYGPGLMLWPESDRAADGFVTFAGLTGADRTTVRSLVMWGGGGGGGGSGKAEAALTGDFTRWHVYRVEWRPGSLKMYVDEQVLFDSAAHPGTVVPSRPMHLVIQVVAGPKDGVPAPDAGTPDTVVTEVDWVRYSG